MGVNIRSITLAISVFFVLSASISAAPGDLDPTFGNGGRLIDGDYSYEFDMAVQSDDKIVVVRGSYLADFYLADFVVARYNANGSPDLTFGSGTGRVTTDLGAGEYAWSVVVQPDGKIVVGGVSATNAAAFNFIVRYNPDGSFDTGFGGGTGKVLTALPCGNSHENHSTDLTIQPDGKFVGAVKFEYCSGQLIRYLSDGSLDVSFGDHGFTTAWGNTSSFNTVLTQPDGKVIWGFEYTWIYRFEPNGSPDLSFGSGGHVSSPFSSSYSALESVITQPDGKIVAMGSGPDSFVLVRYNINGSPDTSFGVNGLVTPPNGVTIRSAAIQPDGKIVAAGSVGSSGAHDIAVVRYNIDGSLDTTFGGGDGISTVDFNNSDDGADRVVLDSWGRAVVAGGSRPVSGGPYMFAIARILGDLTTSTCPNPIDCPDLFVRQHYRDFLNREPDAAGLNFWTGEITSCGADAQCAEVKRVNVSAAFFLSIEFQHTGYLVERIYKAAYGDATDATTGSAVPIIRRAELTADSALVGQNVVVNSPGWEQQLEANKRAYAQAFVQRQRFTEAYPPSMTPAAFVAKLNVNTGGALTQAEVDALVAELSASETAEGRASVLRKAAENAEVVRRERNSAFVLMEYFGYLRRDPDAAPDANYSGYLFWLGKLNQFNGDYVGAEMVKAFITSAEYRRRFGQP